MKDLYVVSKGCYDSRTQKASRIAYFYAYENEPPIKMKQLVNANNAFMAETNAMTETLRIVALMGFNTDEYNIKVFTNNQPLVQKVNGEDFKRHNYGKAEYVELARVLKTFKHIEVVYEQKDKRAIYEQMRIEGEKLCR